MLNVLSGGLHYGWSSPSLPKLLSNDSSIRITTDQSTWIATIIIFGDAFGAFLTFLLLDKLGRKAAILYTAVPYFASWLFIAYATSFDSIIIGRFLGGVGDGITYSSVPIYICEISEPRVRGLLGSGASFVWIAGVFIMNAVGSCLTIKTSALLALIVPAVLLISFPWMPESPYYLLMKNNKEGASQSLKILRGGEEIEVELSRISTAVQQQQASIIQKFIEVFTIKCNRKALFIMLGIRVLQQFCGIGVIMLYAQIIFEEGDTTISSETSSCIYFMLYLISTGICSTIVDKIGRKPLLLISMIGSFAALLVECVYFFLRNKTDIDMSNLTLVPTVGLFFYVALFSVGMQGIPVLLLGELFSTKVKSLAVCISVVVYSIMVAVASKIFQITKEMYGMHVPFIIFSIFCIITIFYIIYCVPETRGQTLEEIQEQLKNGKKHKSKLELVE